MTNDQPPCYTCDAPVADGEGYWCDACWQAILKGGQ